MRWLGTLACAVLLGGCSVQFAENSDNHAIDEINLYAKARGLTIEDTQCPPMEKDEDEYDGETIRCTGALAMTDGTSRTVEIAVSFAKCSLSSHSCYENRVAVDLTP